MGELLTELELTGEDLARAQEATDDHIRAWHLAMVRTEQDRTQDDVAQAMCVAQPREPFGAVDLRLPDTTAT
ncbi:MAG TPA: hypothetical protein VFG35_16495 [Actinoplanes sp.]|nr:hypothetical protein [Actinoplanes sp.]